MNERRAVYQLKWEKNKTEEKRRKHTGYHHLRMNSQIGKIWRKFQSIEYKHYASIKTK